MSRVEVINELGVPVSARVGGYDPALIPGEFVVGSAEGRVSIDNYWIGGHIVLVNYDSEDKVVGVFVGF